MTNSPQFQQAASVVKKLNSDPSNDELQQLYGFYKQATVGNINIEKPGFLNIKGVKKWEAWNKCKGKTTYEAEVEYIKIVNTLLKKYGLQK